MDDRASLIAAGIDALPAQAAILDDEGTIRYTNRYWRTFGEENDLAPEFAHVGANYLEVCDRSADGDEDAATAASGLRSVLAGETDEFAFEYPCHSPDERRWFTMRAIPFDHEGDAFVLVVHLDVTERRLMEERVREGADRLADLARMLSHDLRNPLSVAMAELETLEDDVGRTDRTASIAASLERMEAIVADALALVETETPRNARPVGLERLAEDAWSHVETGGASLRIDGDLTFEADPGLASTLLENLFRNAIDHGPADVAVRVGSLERWPGESTAGFYVEDDGPGIPDGDRDRIFETGYSTSADGTGFGLAIVDRIASVHGWTVDVTESRDGGARFEVTGLSPVRN